MYTQPSPLYSKNSQGTAHAILWLLSVLMGFDFRERYDFLLIVFGYLLKVIQQLLFQVGEELVLFLVVWGVEVFQEPSQVLTGLCWWWRVIVNVSVNVKGKLHQVIHGNAIQPSQLIEDREHKESLAKYPEMRERLQSLLEQGEKITPKQWKAEIQSLQSEYDSISRDKSKTATELAYADARVIIRPSQRNPVKSRVLAYVYSEPLILLGLWALAVPLYTTFTQVSFCFLILHH